MSDPSDRTTVAAPVSATPSAGAVPAGDPSPVPTDGSPTARISDRPVQPPGGGATAAGPSKRAARTRQARVVVRKLGPWSVLKISFLFYVCVLVVFLGAMLILYGVLGAIGALDSLTRLIRDLFADQSFEIHGDWLFTRGLAIGFALVVLWTLINVFVVFLYNLLSDIVGGDRGHALGAAIAWPVRRDVARSTRALLRTIDTLSSRAYACRWARRWPLEGPWGL